MKVLGIIFLTVSLGAFASEGPTYKVSCGVNLQPSHSGYKVSASLKGLVSGKADTDFTLDEASISYVIYSNIDSVWAEEDMAVESLDANENYNPLKYENHVQFKLPSKQGKVELIYPRALGNKKEFRAHLILTGIQDHFGGTAHMYCRRSRVE